MINANELRIGNLVMISPDKIIKVSSIDKNGIELSSGELLFDEDNSSEREVVPWYGSEKINPIPLTPEILEKCGFHKPDEDQKDLYSLCYSEEEDSFMMLKNNTGFVSLSHNIKYVIKYLHELQNSVFWATKYELVINL